MTTLIIMLILMMAPYLVARVMSAVTHRDIDVRSAAAIGAGILFIFTGVGHFIQTEPMAQMLPPWVPERMLLVYLTGVLELAISVGFFVPKARRLTGWVAAVALVLFFPANIYAAINHIPMGGHAWGPVYLLIRAPLQAIILFWVYWFTIRQPNTTLHADAPQAARR
ncbi:MAG TPA: hypothetical protein VG324_24425 [Blastocatellia bacterium]|nr:hypothetical protein [Blastocatellia bacterium]